MATDTLYHFHVCWWDRQPDPEPHILCVTASNKMHATRETDRYIGESLGSIEKVVYKGDAASYIMCLETD